MSFYFLDVNFLFLFWSWWYFALDCMSKSKGDNSYLLWVFILICFVNMIPHHSRSSRYFKSVPLFYRYSIYTLIIFSNCYVRYLTSIQRWRKAYIMYMVDLLFVGKISILFFLNPWLHIHNQFFFTRFSKLKIKIEYWNVLKQFLGKQTE